MNTTPQLIERVRLYEADHDPEGWPAIQMKEVTALADALEKTQQRAESAWQDVSSVMGLLADIREAAGDPQGRLMQPELIARIREQRQVLEQIRNDMRRHPLAAIDPRTLDRLTTVLGTAGDTP